MSYADLTNDVLPRIPAVSALRDEGGPGGLPATQPTRSQAAALLAQVEAEIDGRLRRRQAGITVPVEDPDAIALLLPIAAIGTAAAVLRAAFPQKEGIGGEGGAASELQAQYERMLAAIDEGLLDHLDSGTPNVSHGFKVWRHQLAGAD